MRLDTRGRRDLVVRQDTGAGDELVGRAGRVMCAHRVVEERLVGGLEEGRVILGRDAAGELVVVIRRKADHRQDLAGLRVHDDDDAALEPGLLHAPPERLLRELLLASVDGEPKRTTLLW